jgi:hypothetical protein
MVGLCWWVLRYVRRLRSNRETSEGSHHFDCNRNLCGSGARRAIAKARDLAVECGGEFGMGPVLNDLACNSQATLKECLANHRRIPRLKFKVTARTRMDISMTGLL